MKIDLIKMFTKLASDVDLDPFSFKYCVRRINSEGVKFLTETLPNLSKTVLLSLEKGYFDRSGLTNIAWKGKALRYFRSYLKGIFDLRTGKVLETVDAVALWQLRQLCEYAYKLALPFDEKALESAESDFKSVDAELAGPYDRAFVDQLRKDVSTFFPEIANTQPMHLFAKARPRPGPGTFSEWRKTTGDAWYSRKEQDYRFNPIFSAYSGYAKPYPQAPSQGVEDCDPHYSETLFVPKDSRGPRVIVREPYSLLFYQMAFNEWLSGELTKSSFHRINFQDQSANRRLAAQSSIDGKNCTLDLKSASDRVSRLIARHVFRDCSAIRYFIDRATKVTRLPVSKALLPLNKLAGMGSGLTFPTMSFLIALASVRAISDRFRIPYTTAQRLVYVYGDDIICPTHMRTCVEEALEKIFLRVNRSKSYSVSHFRESCGGDYYDGQDVSPVRLKLSNSNLRSSGTILRLSGASSVLQLERHCRELVKNGLLDLSEYFYALIERSYGALPYVSGDSPALGRYKISPYAYGVLDNGEYEPIRACFAIPVTAEVEKDSYVFLGNFFKRSKKGFTRLDFLNPSEGPTFDAVSIPRCVRLVRRKVSSFRLMG